MAAGWVVVPLLLRRGSLLSDGTSGDLFDAETRRSVALASLREAEYDRVAGKLDDADYARLRAQLEREALAAIDAADAAAREEAGPAAPGEEVAALVQADRSHSCGFENPAGSRFCAGCGQPLT